ncbi:MAG: UDP-glucose 4-epimerase GalE [Vicinamibacteraceae bacterium]
MGRILVAGGAGFIGSFAVRALAAAGHEVVVYDNLRQGHAEAIDRLNAAAPGRTPIRLIQGDIRDGAAVREALITHRIEAVMHFAAWLLVGESVSRPIDYYDNNVGGALAVLGAMAAAKVPAFIFSSTAATFGEPERVPIDEDHPQRPINTYGETKLAIERALPHFERAYGIRSVVLRYFNAAGADPDGILGEDHDPEVHLIPRAIDAILGAEPLSIFGDDYATPDGTCLRDYVHVIDLADAHLLALGHLQGGGTSRAYNLGIGRPFSVREVLQAVEAVAGRPVPHTMGPRRPGDPAVLYALADRIRRDFGWAPSYLDLRTIVDTAWQWRRRHPGGYASGATGRSGA